MRKRNGHVQVGYLVPCTALREMSSVVEAVRWFQTATGMGDSGAMYNLATPRDPVYDRTLLLRFGGINRQRGEDIDLQCTIWAFVTKMVCLSGHCRGSPVLSKGGKLGTHRRNVGFGCWRSIGIKRLQYGTCNGHV